MSSTPDHHSHLCTLLDRIQRNLIGLHSSKLPLSPRSGWREKQSVRDRFSPLLSPSEVMVAEPWIRSSSFVGEYGSPPSLMDSSTVSSSWQRRPQSSPTSGRPENASVQLDEVRLDLGTRLAAVEVTNSKFREEMEKELSRIGEKCRREIKDNEEYLLSKLEEFDKRRMNSDRDFSDRFREVDRSLRENREGIDAMKDNLSRLESVMDEHQSVFLTLDRNIRSSVESSQQEITGRFVLEVDSIRDSVKRYSETLSKYRQDQVDALSDVLERVGQYRSQSMTSIGEMRIRLDDCTQLAIQAGEKVVSEKKRVSEGLLRLDDCEHRIESICKDTRDLRTFRENSYEWRTELQRDLRDQIQQSLSRFENEQKASVQLLSNEVTQMKAQFSPASFQPDLLVKREFDECISGFLSGELAQVWNSASDRVVILEKQMGDIQSEVTMLGELVKNDPKSVCDGSNEATLSVVEDLNREFQRIREQCNEQHSNLSDIRRSWNILFDPDGSPTWIASLQNVEHSVLEVSNELHKLQDRFETKLVESSSELSLPSSSRHSTSPSVAEHMQEIDSDAYICLQEKIQSLETCHQKRLDDLNHLLEKMSVENSNIYHQEHESSWKSSLLQLQEETSHSFAKFRSEVMSLYRDNQDSIEEESLKLNDLSRRMDSMEGSVREHMDRLNLNLQSSLSAIQYAVDELRNQSNHDIPCWFREIEPSLKSNISETVNQKLVSFENELREHSVLDVSAQIDQKVSELSLTQSKSLVEDFYERLDCRIDRLENDLCKNNCRLDEIEVEKGSSSDLKDAYLESNGDIVDILRRLSLLEATLLSSSNDRNNPPEEESPSRCTPDADKDRQRFETSMDSSPPPNIDVLSPDCHSIDVHVSQRVQYAEQAFSSVSQTTKGDFLNSDLSAVHSDSLGILASPGLRSRSRSPSPSTPNQPALYLGIEALIESDSRTFDLSPNDSVASVASVSLGSERAFSTSPRRRGRILLPPLSPSDGNPDSPEASGMSVSLTPLSSHHTPLSDFGDVPLPMLRSPSDTGTFEKLDESDMIHSFIESLNSTSLPHGDPSPDVQRSSSALAKLIQTMKNDEVSENIDEDFFTDSNISDSSVEGEFSEDDNECVCTSTNIPPSLEIAERYGFDARELLLDDSLASPDETLSVSSNILCVPLPPEASAEPPTVGTSWKDNLEEESPETTESINRNIADDSTNSDHVPSALHRRIEDFFLKSQQLTPSVQGPFSMEESIRQGKDGRASKVDSTFSFDPLEADPLSDEESSSLQVRGIQRHRLSQESQDEEHGVFAVFHGRDDAKLAQLLDSHITDEDSSSSPEKSSSPTRRISFHPTHPEPWKDQFIAPVETSSEDESIERFPLDDSLDAEDRLVVDTYPIQQQSSLSGSHHRLDSIETTFSSPSQREQSYSSHRMRSPHYDDALFSSSDSEDIDAN